MKLTILPKFDELISLKLEEDDDTTTIVDKTRYVSIDLKCKAGSQATSEATYKKKILTFENGSPAEFVKVKRALEEILQQNKIERPEDIVNIIRMLILGDSFRVIENSLTEQRVGPADNDGNDTELDMTVDMVDKAIEALAEEIFPH